MKKVLKLIKNFDMYGKGITLNINGKEAINSVCGGGFSLLYLLFFMVIFITNFQTFLKREPIITLSSTFREDSEAYDTIHKSELNFALFLMDFKTIPPHPVKLYPYNITKLSEKLEYVNNTETHEELEKFGSMVKCEESKAYMEDRYFKGPYNIAKIKAKNQNFSICFEVNKENEYFNMGGDTETRNVTYLHKLKLFYDFCELFQKPRNCNLTDDESSELNNFSLITLLKNSHADYNNETGLSYFYEGKKQMLDLDNDYEVQFNSKRLKITTDKNYIYNIFEKEESKSYVHSYQAVTSNKKSDKTELIISVQFQLSNYIDSVERSYLKVDEMLANIGSIIVIVEILASMLAGFFSEGNMEHAIYKEIFHIQKKNGKAVEFLNVDFDLFKIKKKNFANNNAVKGFVKSLIADDKSKLKNCDFINLNKNNANKQISIFANAFKDKKANINIKLDDINQNLSELSDSIKIQKDSDRSINFLKDKSQKEVELKEIKLINQGIDDLKSNHEEIKQNNFIKNTSNKANPELDNLTNSINNLNLNEDNKANDKIIKNDNKSDKNIYDDFRKILKEKTIKKSRFFRLYQTFSCLLKSNKNIRLLIKIQDFISEELDMVKILKKLIEYENFKSLVLTENQRRIFNIMQKRVITEDLLEEEASAYYKDFYFKNKMKDLKNFKYLVDHLFDFDEENKYSKIIIEKLKENFSL